MGAAGGVVVVVVVVVVVMGGNRGADTIIELPLGGLPRRLFSLELPEFVDSSCEGPFGVVAVGAAALWMVGKLEGPATT